MPTMEVDPNKQIREGGAFITPMRYPGGKGRLGPWLAQVLRHNRLSGGWYVEPYAGGAGAALYLLTQGYVENILINDADPAVYNFWRAATTRNSELVRRIQTTPITIETWYEQKAILSGPRGHSILDIGFAALFLNRTNRSGILAGGVIGGKAQAGAWKLDARFNRADLVARVTRIGELADQITATNLDALDLLIDVAPGFEKRCLVYLDPPYYEKGSQLYRNHYVHEDHEAIAYCVNRAEYPVLVTYDNCPEVRAMYEGLSSATFSLRYSTHLSRPVASEVLFYRNIELPSEPTLTRGYHLTQHARTNGEILSQSPLTT